MKGTTMDPPKTPSSSLRPSTSMAATRGSSPPREGGRLIKELSPSRMLARDTSPIHSSSAPSQAAPDHPALFKQKDGLHHLRQLHYLGSLEGDQSANSSLAQPPLLRELQDKLNNLLVTSEKPGWERDGWARLKLRSDAHSQVLNEFVQSFLTYQPLLLGIKEQYDLALQDALASCYDNVCMRNMLALAQQNKVRTMEDTRTTAVAQARSLRHELEALVEEEVDNLVQAEKRCSSIELELNSVRSQVEAMRRECVQLQTAGSQLRKNLLTRSSWSTSYYHQRHKRASLTTLLHTPQLEGR